jgi:dihydrofolate reductase
MQLETIINMADAPKYLPTATIMVAATQSMGMSYKTHLPWPKLKCENGYFETTTRQTVAPGTMNAVIMGYNTWDDEPTKRFSSRINVVVTRNPDKVWSRLQHDKRTEPIHAASSLEEAMEMLWRTYADAKGSSDAVPMLGRVFIIGGAELCANALQHRWVHRLLLTRVMKDFESDTFFPLALDGNGSRQWERQGDVEHRLWVGCHAPIGVQSENGLEWEAYMFERGSA